MVGLGRVGAAVACLAILSGACSATAGSHDPHGSPGEGIPQIAVTGSHTDIVGGTTSPASQDAAVMVSIGDSDLCTGTLIAPNLVLTARHCIANVSDDTECGAFTSDLDPSTMKISIGAKTTPADAVATGTKTFNDGNTSGCSHDVGLILLDKPIPHAVLAPLRFSPLTKGEAAIAVGYGADASGRLTQAREQRAGLAVLDIGPIDFTYTPKKGAGIPVAVAVGELVTGESTCFGDSGGPLFDAQGNIIGITSRGIDENCVDRPTIYMDIASHLGLISKALTAAGYPLILSADGDGGIGTVDASAPAGSDDHASPDPNPNDGNADASSSETPLANTSGSVSEGCSIRSGREGADPVNAFWLLTGAALVLGRRRKSD